VVKALIVISEVAVHRPDWLELSGAHSLVSGVR